MDGILKTNLEKINVKIQKELLKNSSLASPNIIAVSKKQRVEKVKKLYELGVRNFGENYLQEALPKIEALRELDINWHFIGKIQSNKIKDIVENFELIHTVSRLSEAHKISRAAKKTNKIQKILLQVNIACEKTKQGFDPSEIKENMNEISDLNSIELCGLMVFPPLSKNDTVARDWFFKSHELFVTLKANANKSFCRLSMGTSRDFPLAIESGSTDIRVGELLMGQRT